MSMMHKQFGHFSRPTKRLLLRSKVCPCCGRPAGNLDHIFPLNALEALGENAMHAFGVADIHAPENGWHICTKCHSDKSRDENAAWPHGDKLSAVYNKWWKKAFTATGRRRIWKGEINMKGVRAARNRRLIIIRAKARQKVA